MDIIADTREECERLAWLAGITTPPVYGPDGRWHVTEPPPRPSLYDLWDDTGGE